MKFKFKNIADTSRSIPDSFSKERKLKSSRKRAQIIEYFLKQDKHFSTEELYQNMKRVIPGIGFSTIYRTLKLLTDCGLASEIRFESGTTRFEPIHKEQHHDHLICKKCGAIIEFTDRELEKIQHKIAKKRRFKLTDHKLEIYGICQKCAAKRKK